MALLNSRRELCTAFGANRMLLVEEGDRAMSVIERLMHAVCGQASKRGYFRDSKVLAHPSTFRCRAAKGQAAPVTRFKHPPKSSI